MSKKEIDAGELSARDQEALAAVQGMGISGLGQPQQTAAPEPEKTPVKEKEDIKPAPQPGTGTASAADVPKSAGGDEPQAGAKPIEIKSPLGSKTFGATKEPVLTSFEDVQAYAKESGIELENVDAFRTLIGTVTELQKKAEEAQTLQTMVSQYKNQFGNLPPEVANIVDAAINGQDYKSIVKDIAAGVTLDLSRNFADHNTVNLIRQYAQPDMTQEAYDELTDANKAALSALAKNSYESDQARYQKAVADQSANKREFEQKYAKSIDDALAHVKQEFPTMDQAALKLVRDKMEFGLVQSLFNEDNTYKPDAGVKIAMQEFGQEAIKDSWNTIGQLAQQMESKIQGKTFEGLVQRGDKPDQQGRQVADNSNSVAEAVAKQTSFLKARS